MPGYFYRSFDPKTRSCKPVGIHDGDWWELTQLAGRLRDAAEFEEPVAEGLKVPTMRQVDALPSFDPESIVLLGEDPAWKRFGSDSETFARWCTASTLARYEKAMRSIDACIPASARGPWKRYLDAVSKLVANKQGLYCSSEL